MNCRVILPSVLIMIFNLFISKKAISFSVWKLSFHTFSYMILAKLLCSTEETLGIISKYPESLWKYRHCSYFLWLFRNTWIAFRGPTRALFNLYRNIFIFCVFVFFFSYIALFACFLVSSLFRIRFSLFFAGYTFYPFLVVQFRSFYGSLHV